MKISFNKPLLDLDEKPILTEAGNEINMSKEFARHLSSDPHKDSGIAPLDAFEVSLQLNRLEEIDLKSNEQDLYKKFITNSQTMTSLFKGQLLQCFVKEKE